MRAPGFVPHRNWRRLRLVMVLAVGAFLSSRIARASDLTEIVAVTNGILLLHFDDGQVQYHGYHQTDKQDRVVQNKLDTDGATKAANYKLSSSDDSDYASAANPLRAGRKSKGKGFSRNCIWDGLRCNDEYTLEHWIYLLLPQPLKRGKSYTLKTGSLAANGQEWTVKYDEYTLRSAAIHVNQVGYLPQARVKYCYISQWMGDLGPLSLEQFAGSAFHLVRTDDGQVVFSGKISKQKDLATGGPDTGQSGVAPGGNFVGADVWQCDFSAFHDPGEYRLVVEGMGCSYAFSIGDDVYRQAFYTAIRGLYHQRSGIDLKEPFTHWTRKADHRVGIVPGYSLKYTSYRYMDSSSESGPEAAVRSQIQESVDTTNMWGWYHDAGDWDAYPSHAEVPAYLLTAYELAPGNFKDGELNIPESGNGIPDILDEASWLLNFYRRAKGPSGGVAGSRVHGDFSPEPQGIPSNEDTRQWIIFGEEPLMTFKYAALAAHLGYCYQLASNNGRLGPGVNPQERIELWKGEAKKAFQWASDHTLPGDSVKEARAYAAAWLYRLTGELSYQTQFIKDLAVSSGDIRRFGDFRWAVWAYVTAPSSTPGLNTPLFSDLTLAAKSYARQEVTDAIDRNRSFRAGGHWWMPVIAGQATTPLVLPAMIAYKITGEQKFLDAVVTTCDYMLGGNPLDMVWVSGLGKKSPAQLLHLDSWYGSTSGFIPGIVPYGPIYKCDWFSGPGGNCDFTGPWDADFSRTTAYPDAGQWPIHELFFENRYCPPSNEFTVHQNIAAAASAYGFLSGPVPAGTTSLVLSSLQVQFSRAPGGIHPAPIGVGVTNGGTGLLAWSAVSSAPWLKISPASGTTPARDRNGCP